MLKPLYFILWSLILFGCADRSEPILDQESRPNVLLLIADDWSYPHAGFLGDPVVRTPTFDRLAANGSWFESAFVASPSCSPSRASILNGRYPHRNKAMANLWSVFTREFPTYTDELEKAGYLIGAQFKGWGPGRHPEHEHNPAGKRYANFRSFLDERSTADQPFCYWFGTYDPHRPYQPNTGVRTGMALDSVVVPPFFPDNDCVRGDMLDYFYEIERFDRMAGDLIDHLAEIGELDNTLVIVTSDNGMPFPRAKANLYDYGTRVPLILHWPAGIGSPGRQASLASLIDLAPTILGAAGLEAPTSMDGDNLLPIISGVEDDKDHVFVERERHANVRAGNLSYPMRGIRTKDYLLIRNFETDRWPAGDPTVHRSVGQYGDIDNSITKFLIEANPDLTSPLPYFQLTFGKRPAYELYDLQEDPGNIRNLVEDPDHQEVFEDLKGQLNEFMSRTGDPRAETPKTIYWDTVEYVPVYYHDNYPVDSLVNAWKVLVPRPNNTLQFEEVGCL